MKKPVIQPSLRKSSGASFVVFKKCGACIQLSQIFRLAAAGLIAQQGL
jgi:hypothetical protein